MNKEQLIAEVTQLQGACQKLASIATEAQAKLPTAEQLATQDKLIGSALSKLASAGLFKPSRPSDLSQDVQLLRDPVKLADFCDQVASAALQPAKVASEPTLSLGKPASHGTKQAGRLLQRHDNRPRC